MYRIRNIIIIALLGMNSGHRIKDPMPRFMMYPDMVIYQNHSRSQIVYFKID